MINFWIDIALCGFILAAILGDMLQYQVRFFASVLGISNVATHLTSLSMLINRVGASVALLLIGFVVDNLSDPSLLTTRYSLVLFLAAALYICASLLVVPLLSVFSRGVNSYYRLLTVAPTHIETKTHTKRMFSADVVLTQILFNLGLLGPSILAMMNPDYRATLMQTGFMLNSFATVYFVVFIEKKMADVLIATDDAEKFRFLSKFNNSRAIGSVCSALLLMLFELILL